MYLETIININCIYYKTNFNCIDIKMYIMTSWNIDFNAIPTYYKSIMNYDQQNV